MGLFGRRKPDTKLGEAILEQQRRAAIAQRDQLRWSYSRLMDHHIAMLGELEAISAEGGTRPTRTQIRKLVAKCRAWVNPVAVYDMGNDATPEDVERFKAAWKREIEGDGASRTVVD